MKLYTEEQLIKAMRFCYMHEEEETLDEFFDSLTPIELPSNEEIEKQLELYASEDYIIGKRTGMFYVISYIKQQVK